MTETLERSGLRKDHLRDRVWREFVKHGNSDAAFYAAVNTMGAFHFLRIVDQIVDVIVDEQNVMEPVTVRLDLAEQEIVNLRKLLDEARSLVGAK